MALECPETPLECPETPLECPETPLECPETPLERPEVLFGYGVGEVMTSAGIYILPVYLSFTLFSPFLMPDAVHPLYPCHSDEVAPLAKLLRVSAARDFADLHDLLPDDYPDPVTFFKAYDKAVQDATDLVSSATQQGQGMQITAHIQEIYNTLPRQLDRLSARVRRAGELTVPLARFGIAAARAARNNNEHVPLASALKTLLQNIAANAKALALKGHTPADTKQLQELYDDLSQDTTDRGSSVSTQKGLTEANIKTLNTLWAMMKHLLNDGKDLYRTSDKPKLDDYTVKQLLKKVRLTPAARPAGAKGGAGAA